MARWLISIGRPGHFLSHPFEAVSDAQRMHPAIQVIVFKIRLLDLVNFEHILELPIQHRRRPIPQEFAQDNILRAADPHRAVNMTPNRRRSKETAS